MFVYILRRLGQGIIVTVGVVILVFVLVRLAPGDPVRLMNPRATEAQLPELRHQYGLDRPVLVQLGDWAVKAATGNFGDSLYLRVPVRDAIAEAVPKTFLLVIASTI